MCPDADDTCVGATEGTVSNPKTLELVFDSISGNTEARIQQNQDFRW